MIVVLGHVITKCFPLKAIEHFHLYCKEIDFQFNPALTMK